MYTKQKLLEMITSEKSSARYDACEWLRVSQESAPEIIYALQKASNDPDAEVASRASYALQADVHHRQAVSMGLAAPDERELPVAPPASPINQAQLDHLSMLGDIRGWAIWILISGVFSLLASGLLSSSWGVILIIVGLASFYFRTASMFVVYGVIMVWAAIQNISALQPAWIIIGAVQIYIIVRVIINFRRYRKAELELQQLSTGEIPVVRYASRAASAFPWIGAFFSLLSFIGVIFGFLMVILLASEGGGSAVPSFLYFVIDLTINIGVLGFALGLASILSRYHPKILGWLAIIVGALTLLIGLGLILLSLLG